MDKLAQFIYEFGKAQFPVFVSFGVGGAGLGILIVTLAPFPYDKSSWVFLGVLYLAIAGGCFFYGRQKVAVVLGKYLKEGRIGQNNIKGV